MFDKNFCQKNFKIYSEAQKKEREMATGHNWDGNGRLPVLLGLALDCLPGEEGLDQRPQGRAVLSLNSDTLFMIPGFNPEQAAP